MENASWPVDWGLCTIRLIRQLSAGADRRCHLCSDVFHKKYFILVLCATFGVILVLVVLMCETLVELAAAATVHHGLIPVLTKVFGDIVLVRVEVSNNHHLTEGGGQEGH